MSATDERGTAAGPPPPAAGRKVRGCLRLVVLVALMVIAALVLPTTAFIGVQCYRPTNDRGQTDRRPGAGYDPGYERTEAMTYLTLPEWFIVYSTDEYARLVQRASPSEFPYLGSAREFWGYYAAVCREVRSKYAFDAGAHVMLGTIGVSFTVESAIKGLYEQTVGRLSAWVGTRDTAEDRFAAEVAAEYGTFMHTVPWYEFDFAGRLRRLWTDVPWSGAHLPRKLERRMALSAEYGVKALYGWLIGRASQGAYGPQDLTIQALVAVPPDTTVGDSRVEEIRRLPDGTRVVRLPRYEAFTHTMLSLLDLSVQVLEIAGNDEILMTVLAPSALTEQAPGGARVVANRPVLTDRSRKRLALSVPVARLHDTVALLRAEGATIEHLYDY